MEHERDYTVHHRKVRGRRLRKGWRQEDLAKRTGLTPGTVSRIETGYHPYTQLGTLGKLANALGCSVDDLVEWHVEI
jgi:transcriptional regulator with XRE-family HTH domain